MSKSTTSRATKPSPKAPADEPIPFVPTEPAQRVRVIVKPSTTVREILTARLGTDYEHPRHYSWDELAYACVQIAEDAVFDMTTDPECQAARRSNVVALAALADLTLRAHVARFGAIGGAK